VPWLPGLFYRLNYLLNRCILVPTSRISSTARVGRWVGLSFANVGPGAVLEDGVVIARNVRHRKAVQEAYIEIEAGAKIGAKALIVGVDGMRIGEGARVEAGAVVHKSVPSGGSAAGVPAQIVARQTGKAA
jgi:serine acetyltransferase